MFHFSIYIRKILTGYKHLFFTTTIIENGARKVCEILTPNIHG